MRLQNVVRVAQLIIMKHEEMLTDWLRIVIEGALRNGFSQWLKAARVGIWLRRLCSIQQEAGKTNLLCWSFQRVAKSVTTEQIFPIKSCRETVLSDRALCKSMNTNYLLKQSVRMSFIWSKVLTLQIWEREIGKILPQLCFSNTKTF